MSPLFLAVALSVAQVPGSEWPEPRADVAFEPSQPQRGLVTVWTDDRRGERWGAPRGNDLWINALSADGGVRPGVAYGYLLCRGLQGETLSSARIATSAAGAMVAWKVAWDGGEAIRASHVSWSSTAPSIESCDAGVVVVSDGGLRALQLESSGGEYLVTWEDDQSIRGRFVGVTAAPFDLAGRGTTTTSRGPSLAPGASGFYVGWQDESALHGTAVSLLANGGQVSHYDGLHILQNTPLNGPPLLAGAPAAVALPTLAANGSNGLELQVGRPPLDGAELLGPDRVDLAPGPLAMATTFNPASAERFSWVAHKALDGGTVVSRFGPLSALTVGLQQPSLAAQAMAMVGSQPRVLAASDGFLAVVNVPPFVVSTPELAVVDRNRALADQRAPSAVWSREGGWALGWNEPPIVKAFGVTPDNLQFPFNNAQVDGGLARFLPLADGAELVASFEGRAGSGIIDLTTQAPRLLTPGSFSAAIAGRAQSLMWGPGSGNLAYGGVPADSKEYPALLGRCGAWANGRLLVPIIYNGNELKLVSLSDEAGTFPELLGPIATTPELRSPCLAADGDRLLVVASNVDGALLVFETTVSDAVAGRAATNLTPLPERPGGLAVIDPVAARTPRGWQLAWYSLTRKGALVLQASFERGGLNPRGEPVTFDGEDDREPQLSPSATGPVLLHWRRFQPETGNVIVKWKVLPQEAAPTDGGVTEDGGVDAGPAPVDGGVDAGVPASDGGVDDVPMQFRTCGCDAAPTLLAVLGVALLARRRRSER